MSNFEKREATVFDASTGLTWELQVREGAPIDSIPGVNAANVGGYSDWRLPSVEEMETIVDTRRINPAIDLEFFPGTPNTSFQTTRAYVRDARNYRWIVDMRSGGSRPEYRSDTNYSFRLVRGTMPVRQVSSTSEIVHIGTLQWKRATEQGVYTHILAMQLGTSDRTGGYTDWRLPTIEELRTLVDRSRIDPAINPLFTDTQLEQYWTSTPAENFARNKMAWTVEFINGATVPWWPTFNHPVRLVRTAGAQAAPVPTPTPTPTPTTAPTPVPVPTGETLEAFKMRLLAFINA